MPDRPVTSVADLKSRVELLRPTIFLPETEDSWETISKALKSLNDLCLNGACDFPAELISTVRSISRPVMSSMVSERTRLSGVAIDLTSTLAAGLGTSFEPLLPTFLPVLLSLCGRTNKVIIARARICIKNIIETTQLPSVLSYFLQSIKDKSTSVRFTAAEGTLTCMNCLNPPDLEKETRARDIETVIRTTARDAQADIRAVSRKVFEAYKLLLPNRIESFIAPLSPTMKKYLDIKIAKAPPEPPISALTCSLDAKNPLSSSTSAMASARGRTKSGPSAIHARSASSSALSTEPRAATVNLKAPAPTKRPKPTKTTDMPPPPYIPVRPVQSSKAVSVSRSMSAVEARPPIVSTTLLLRPGAAVNPSKPPVASAVRPNSANSHREIPQRLQTSTTNSSRVAQELPSGPRRVPIADAASKGSETNKRQQGVTRARMNFSAPRPDTDVKPTNTVANPSQAAPIREKPKPIPKVFGTQSGTSSRSAKSAGVPGKGLKSGGVMQPTLSQLSRVKATTERKAPGAGAPQQVWGRPTSKSSSTISTVQKGKARLGLALENEGKKSIQPRDIPLPPSPVPPAIDMPLSDGEEPTPPPEIPPAPLLAPVALSIEVCSTTAAIEEVARQPSSAEEGNDTVCTEESSGDCMAMVTEPTQELNTPNAAQEATNSKTIVLGGDLTTTNGQALKSCVDPAHGVLIDNPATPRTSDSISDSPAKTPISSLLSSIQRGFLFTPSSPLSPPQSYLARGLGMQDLPTPFPVSVDGSDVMLESRKTFMFGVGEDYGRSTLGNVGNLNVHK